MGGWRVSLRVCDVAARVCKDDSCAFSPDAKLNLNALGELAAMTLLPAFCAFLTVEIVRLMSLVARCPPYT